MKTLKERFKAHAQMRKAKNVVCTKHFELNEIRNELIDEIRNADFNEIIQLSVEHI